MMYRWPRLQIRSSWGSRRVPPQSNFRNCIAGTKTVSASMMILLFVAILPANGQSNGSWQKRAPLPTARQELATAALDGKVYVMGGYDINLNSTALVEVYDPGTDTWSTIHPLPSATNHNA